MPSEKFKESEAFYRLKKITPTALFGKKPDIVFDDIVKKIEESEAYQDAHSNIIIDKTNNVIHFGHSLIEINASFPFIKELILPKKPFTEKSIGEFSGVMIDAIIPLNFRDSIEDKQTKLAKEAEKYFNQLEPNIYDNSQQKISNNPDDAFMSLFEKNKFTIIGEAHEEKSGKKMIIENMPELKKNGLTTIFLEHVLNDTQGEALNAYLKNETKIMPRMLKDYLMWLDSNNKLGNPNEFAPYGFLSLVMQAKECGIKIIAPIDTSVSYSIDTSLDHDRGDESNRCKTMNYIAAKQIEKYAASNTDEKFLVFCGVRHVNNKISNVPGISEITGSPSTVVRDIGKKDTPKEGVTLSPKNSPADPDILICINTNLGTQAKLLQDKFYSQTADAFYIRLQDILNTTRLDNQKLSDKGITNIIKTIETANKIDAPLDRLNNLHNKTIDIYFQLRKSTQSSSSSHLNSEKFANLIEALLKKEGLDNSTAYIKKMDEFQHPDNSNKNNPSCNVM